MTEDERSPQPPTCRPQGLVAHLAPEVSAGLAALSNIGRALTGTGGLEELAAQALAELRRSLSLDTAALYLPDPERPILRLSVQSPPGGSDRAAAAEVVLGDDAWRFAVGSARPLVFNELGGWLLDNPFDPPAEHWMMLPLVVDGALVGVALAARRSPLELNATSAVVLSLLCDQLGVGIATPRLRQELARQAHERERLRLAAELHDGLAQSLALAIRELALLESRPAADVAAASRARLRETLRGAHELVRARLTDLTATPPIDGLRAAVEETCRRFARLGLPVRVDAPAAEPVVAPAPIAAVMDRVLSEALANAHRRASASAVVVRLRAERTRVQLIVEDDGRGVDASAVAGRDAGHLGLALMRERAREAGGEVRVDSRSGGGRRIALVLPLTDPADPRSPRAA